MTLPEVQSAIFEKKICVLIPTYNNEKTLKRVIDGVLQYTENIIVVNDGSTDSTQEILSQ
ncbi:MAG: glycosyltransferase family 2 protein, partial [Chryseobacterium sp.]